MQIDSNNTQRKTEPHFVKDRVEKRLHSEFKSWI